MPVSGRFPKPSRGCIEYFIENGKKDSAQPLWVPDKVCVHSHGGIPRADCRKKSPCSEEFRKPVREHDSPDSDALVSESLARPAHGLLDTGSAIAPRPRHHEAHIHIMYYAGLAVARVEIYGR